MGARTTEHALARLTANLQRMKFVVWLFPTVWFQRRLLRMVVARLSRIAF